MLGKTIKNEFVNRWRQVAAIFGGFITFSLIVLVLGKLSQSVIVNSYFKNLVLIIDGIYMFASIGVIIALMIMPFGDFRTRFYKDEGYLTHTLPVKTSTLVTGRMICDLCMVILAAVIWPLGICIAAGKANIYSQLVDNALWGIKILGNTVDRALVVGVMVQIFIFVFLGILFTLWMLNAAYAFGHMFNRGKRVKSVAGFIGFAIIFELVIMLLDKITQIEALEKAIDSIIQKICGSNEVATAIYVFGILNIGMIVGVVLLAIVTAYIMKKHLNLE